MSVYRIWEACWSQYLTENFQLFFAVAIVLTYGEEVISQQMKPDETLLYFTSLAMHMDGDIVLKKVSSRRYCA